MKLLRKIGVGTIFLNSCLANASPLSHSWASAEYLNWWIQNSPVRVPLVVKNNDISNIGAINQPGTSIIFGSGSNRNNFNFDGISGGRITLGKWLESSDHYGIEASAFVFSQAKSSFSASSLGQTVPEINIPFFSTTSGEDVLVFHHPNTATVNDSMSPWGIEINALVNQKQDENPHLIYLVGFRYINLDEDFMLNDAIVGISSLPVNSVLNVTDNFSAKNHFYGLQVGAKSNFNYHKLNLNLTALLSVGENFQKLIISGQTNINNSTVIQPIGLFAEPSNIGTFHRNQFAIVPELRIKLEYQLTTHVFPFVTYNIFYINNMIRPANQIDRTINLSQNALIGGTGVLTGPRSPAPTFHSSSFWMQGISIGLKWNID